MAPSFTQIALARQLHEAQLFKDPNVLGIGSGYKLSNGQATDTPALLIYVTTKVPKGRLPESRYIPPKLTVYNALEGKDQEIVTDVIETGPLFALSYTGRYRPAPGGVSIGHPQTTAGTLGGYVQDQESGELLILSNNHVLANQNQCQAGDPIFQQGPLDGGQEPIATLLRWVPLDFSPTGSNLVDAAVARPIVDDTIDLSILNLGPGPNALAPAVLGMSVQKCGRTTERTIGGRITCLDAAFRVDYAYGGTRRAAFRDLIVISSAERFSQPGDSGSFIITDEPDPRLTGLLFAGNASGSFSLANHIQPVFSALRVALVSAPSEIIRGTSWQSRMNDLRALRDQVLKQLPEGQRYLLLLQRHNSELWRLFATHPDLRKSIADLAVPLLDEFFASQQTRIFDQAFFGQARALLEQMHPLASLSLQKTLAWARKELGRYENKTVADMIKELKKPSLTPPQAGKPDRRPSK
jgi:hypothetical protein